MYCLGFDLSVLLKCFMRVTFPFARVTTHWAKPEASQFKAQMYRDGQRATLAFVQNDIQRERGKISSLFYSNMAELYRSVPVARDCGECVCNVCSGFVFARTST